MMKQLINKAFLGAIAFVSAIGFSACSDDNVVAETNPNYNPETGEVNIDFVFNVSTANEPFTRMSAANTQADITQTAFRGITDAYLAAFSQNNDGLYVTNAGLTANKLHNLGPVIGAGKLNPNQTASGDVTQSRRVLQLSLAQGTNSLMFWGKAPKTGTDLEQGRITMNIGETPSATTISMCKIVPETAYDSAPNVDQATLGKYEGLLAAVLTYIINSGISNQDVSFGGTNKTVTLNWKDYVTVTGDAGSYTLGTPAKDPSDNTKNLSLLSERLNFTFKRLNTIHSGELRAGCGHAIADMVTDVMANIDQVIAATPLNIEEVVAQEVAKDIKARVIKFFEFSNGEYVWKSTSEVKTAATFVGSDDKSAISDSHDLNEFPAFFNLPLGSTILELAIAAATSPATGYTYTYNYAGSVDTYAMGGQAGNTNTAFDPKNYMYPAELCYFGNSSIRVTDDTKAAGDYPDGVTNWETGSSWTGWTTNSHVASSTRSVAMKDNINYGTALLESKVKYGATTLQDNNHNLQDAWSNHTVDEPNNTIDVSTRNDHFVLTGILVGGQNPDVGWNYIAKGTSTGFGAIVYDKAVSTVNTTDYIEIPAATGTGSSSSEAVYTLLWDNWDASLKGQKQRDVYVAVEFVNNSKDFYGENNLIRNGATFYIVGKLDPDKKPASLTDVTDAAYAADKSLGITWPTNYALPPYETAGDNAGKTIKERRVFIQDYMTKATFVIGAESLQHALVAVPDLRSGQISLGLSVDLSWRTGINFGDVILGQ